MPEYMKNISESIHAAIESLEAAAGIVEESTTYNDMRDPFHAGSVAVYNRLLTMLLDLDAMEV